MYIQCQKSFKTPWAGAEIKPGLLANIFLEVKVLECPFLTNKTLLHFLLPLDFGFDGVIKIPPPTAGTHALKTCARIKFASGLFYLFFCKDVVVAHKLPKLSVLQKQSQLSQLVRHRHLLDRLRDP